MIYSTVYRILFTPHIKGIKFAEDNQPYIVHGGILNFKKWMILSAFDDVKLQCFPKTL